MRIWLLALPVLLLATGAVWAQNPPATAPSSLVAGQATEQFNYSSVSLTERCIHCHKDTGEMVGKSRHSGHYDTGAFQPSTADSCEGCHGPGQTHADREIKAEQEETKDSEAKTLIFDFTAKTTTPDMVDKRCLSCHASDQTHRFSSNSFHRQNDVSCINCHSAHHAATKEFLLVKTQPNLCFTCHLQQKSQFNMPFRHRVLEGLIQCNDCHNQHGTEGVWESSKGFTRQVQTADNGDFVCFKCHKDKQGPFVFQHASVAVEGCATCHIPHGGANPHMLKYSNVNLLCLQCHTAAHFGKSQAGTAPNTGFPVMNARESIQEQACTLCHTMIHGSNFNTLFFR